LGSERATQRDETARPVKYRFGRFTLDDGAGLLKSDEREVPLRPKSFEVLRYLVEHPQQVISRTKLLRAVWPDVVVSEDSVTQCLVDIRRALDDHDHTLVRTLPKRGYMLDLPVITQPTTHGTFRAWRGAGRKRLLSRRPPSRWTVVALIFLALCIAATWWRAGIQG
jgi:DNA-binding winged helix-turn-helix (wHTH) protein